MSQDHRRHSHRSQFSSARQLRCRRQAERAAHRSEQRLLAFQRHRATWHRRWTRWREAFPRFVPLNLSWFGAFAAALVGMVRAAWNGLKEELGEAALRAMPKATMIAEARWRKSGRGNRRRSENTRLQSEALEARYLLTATAWVDDSWASLDIGDPIDHDNDINTPDLIFGTDAFATIQAGVDAVDAGGTVNVAAGSYSEDVVVNTQGISLLGAQAGLDARGRIGNEAHLIGSLHVAGSADSITIDGFKITVTVPGPLSNTALHVQSESATIQNNIVRGVPTTGPFTQPGMITLNGTKNATVTQNDLELHFHTGGQNGILVNLPVDADEILIADNWISNAHGGAIGVMNMSDADVDITIAGNKLADSGDAIWLAGPGWGAMSNGAVSLTANEFENNAVQLNDLAQIVDIDAALTSNNFDRSVVVRDSDTNAIQVARIFSGIQAGINAASSGDTIEVAAGTYVGDISFANTTDLKLYGAQQGVSAGVGGPRNASSTAGESIIVGNFVIGGGAPTINGLTLDGFRLENTASAVMRINGDYALRNMVVQQSGGLYFLISVGIGSGHTLELTDSTITSPRGFSLDNGHISSATISNNVFHQTAASLVSASSLDGVLTLDGSEFNGPRGVNLLTNDNAITNNVFNIIDAAGNIAIALYEITGNTITGNTFNTGAAAEGMRALAGGRGEASLNNTVENNVFDEIAVNNTLATTIVALGENEIDGVPYDAAVFGSAAADSIVVPSGDTLVQGGAGIDTAVFSGNYADYTIVLGPSTVTVTGAGVNSTLSSIEVLEFDDETILLVGPSSSFTTIQAAINAAPAGAIIHVAAGTYDSEPLNRLDLSATSGITLLGAQAGVSAGVGGTRDISSTAGETIVKANLFYGGGNPTSGDMTIDGFRFEVPGTFSTGVRLNNATLLLQNNIVEHTGTGVGSGAWFLTVVGVSGSFGKTDNEIHIAGNTIDGFSRGPNLEDINTVTSITDNVINATDYGVVLSGAMNIGSQVTGNEITATNRGIAVISSGHTLSGNTISSATEGAIRLSSTADGSTLTITNNTILATSGNPAFAHHGTGTLDLVGGGNTINGLDPDLATYSQRFDLEDLIFHRLDQNGLTGLVNTQNGNVYVTQNSGSVQRGVDAVTAGGTVHIASGSYAGNVNATSNSVLLAPGNSPGQVVINGDLVLDSDDTLLIEINGPSPSAPIEYDNFIVNGTVSLGDAALSIELNYLPAPGSLFTLVDNDAADAVTGTWLGLPEGTTIAVTVLTGPDAGAMIPFTISYIGGDGNDVVFGATPSVAYVNAAWASETIGDDPDAGGAAIAFGYDAFATIEDALAAVIPGGTIYVVSDSYTSAALNLVDDVDIIGVDWDSINELYLPGGVFDLDVSSAFIGVSIASSADVLISGMNLTNFSSTGIEVQGTLELNGSTITGALTGIYVNGGALTMDSTVVQDATIFGVQVGGGGSAVITASELLNNGTAGLIVSAGNANVSGAKISGNSRGVLVNATGTATVTGSDLSGNTVRAIDNATATIVNASGNWWGTVIESGPGSVASSVLGLIDFSPYLASGTDLDSGAVGFGADTSHLHVTALGSQVGAIGRIQEAINLLANGTLTDGARIVDVNAGTYVELVEVNKSATLLGAQAGVDARTRAAVPESRILPSVSGPDPNTAPYPNLMYITASNVTIDGFTFDGDNPGLTSGVVVNGADIDAEQAIASYEGVGGMTVVNNVIRNLSYAGIDFYNYYNSGGATSNNTISQNLIENLGGFDWGIGILIYNNFYADITDNLIRDVRVGIQTGNFYQANPGSTGSITGNEIDARRLGIFYNLHYNAASPFDVSDNMIGAVDDPSAVRWTGMLISSQQGAVDATISGNQIDGSGANASTLTVGYNVWNTPTTADLTITGGTVANVDYGIWVNNYEGYNSNANNTQITIDGVSISANEIGVYVLDSPSNTNGATVHAKIQGDTDITTGGLGTGILVSGSDASAEILNNNASIHGNVIGIDVDGGAATITGNNIYDNVTGIRFTGGGSGSVTGNNFAGATDNDTDLLLEPTAGTVTIGAGNAFAGETFYIDNQTTQSYDLSANGTTFDETNNFRIEDRMHHRMDTDLPLSNGLITWVADTLFVTTPGGLSTDSGIQWAIDAASTGFTIQVEDGTYVEQINIDKPLTLVGQSQANAIIQAPAVLTLANSFFVSGLTRQSVVAVQSATGVTIENLTVDGAGSGATVVPGNDFHGIGIKESSVVIDGVTVTGVRDATLSGMQRGRAIFAGVDSGSYAITVQNSQIVDYQKNGIDFRGDIIATLTGSTITGVGPTTTIAQNGIVLLGGATGVISGNTISGNEYTPAGTSATGILLFNSGAGVVISANTLSDNEIGVNVFGSSTATITGHDFASGPANGTDVRVDGGTALLEGNTFAATIGLLIQNGAIVDAGQSGHPGPSPFTGLGISSGNNDFTAYASSSATDGAIVNLNGNPPNDLAGSQGAPWDATAFGNLGLNEAVVWHDADDAAVGFVDFANLDNLVIVVDFSVIDENGTVELSGSFTNDGQDHTLTIDWKDGNIQVIHLLPGVFNFSMTHTYLDDGPSPGNFTSSDIYSIEVTVQEGWPGVGASVNDTIDVTVNNVAPTLVNVVGATINEGDEATITMEISDPGTLDVFSVEVDWQDSNVDTITGLGLADVIGGVSGSTTYTWIAATRELSLSHLYIDNGIFNVALTVTDDDTGTSGTSVLVTVNNVAPVITGVLINGVTSATIDENGLVTVTGSFTDAGINDTHTVLVDWGNGDTDNAIIVPDGPGAWTFSVSYTYLDDGPSPGNNTPFDVYGISVTVTDNDSSVAVDNTLSVTVNNVAPTLVNVVGATINEGDEATITMEISDPGTLDVFSVEVDWQDSNVDTITGLGLADVIGGVSGSTTYTWIAATRELSLSHLYIDNGIFNVALTVTDDDTGTSGTSVLVTVNNVAPVIALAGAATHNEGATVPYSLTLGPITDPGDDTVISATVFWGDGNFTVLSPAQLAAVQLGTTVINHIYDDNALYTGPITVTLVDEDGTHIAAGTKPLVVNNVAPTATAINGGAVNEGSSGLVLLVGQFDPSNNDTAAGFRYAYDFDNNGIWDLGDGTYGGSVLASSAIVPGSVLNNGPSGYTVKARIIDKDGGFNDYTTIIFVNNVAPVVNAGSDTVAFGGVPFNRTVTFTDPGNEPFWTVEVDWTGDLIPDESFLVYSHSFNINHTYSVLDIGNSYNVTVWVSDGTSTSSDSFVVDVVEDTFRVTSFTSYASGFDVTFNRSPDLDDLNLYYGLPGGFDAADVTLTGAVVGQVQGSMVWNEATNTLSFIKTGGVLAADTYTVTLVSAANGFNDLFGALLDGNNDYVPGGNYTNSFVVAPSAARVVSIRDFARGPGQTVDDTPAVAGSKLAVRIDNANSVTALDFDVHYDPDLLTINTATLATGLPLGWSITINPISPGLIKVTASGTTALSGTNVPVVLLDASVPNSAPYGESQVLRLANVRVNEDLIASKADYAIHKNAYLGDVDGDGFYLGNDASLISRVVVNLDSGFAAHRWTDPLIVGDTTGDGTLSGLDASYVAQKAVFLPRPEIPNLPGVVLIPSAPGIDPELSIPLGITAAPGDSITVPVNIDIEPLADVYSTTFQVNYDTNVLAFDSADHGAFWTLGDGWSLIINDTNPGELIIVMYNSLPSVVGAGTIVDLNFDVLLTAPWGTSPLEVTKIGPNEGGLTWTEADGSVIVGVPGVVGRHIFYNQSKFDGNNAGINATPVPGINNDDDDAIAPDKVAFNGIGTAPLSAFTNYSRGINGIMVDIEYASGTLTLDDFAFKVGNNNMPSLWADAPAPNGFLVRTGQGVGGSDRVVITWANNAIENQWLQIIVKGNDVLGGFNSNTGLAASDVFFYGNRIGDTFESSPATIVVTNVNDEISVRSNSSFSQPITAIRDFNKDGLVNVNDEIIARSNPGFLTRVINWVPPAAPEASPLAVIIESTLVESEELLELSTDDGISSGLAASLVGSGPATVAGQAIGAGRPQGRVIAAQPSREPQADSASRVLRQITAEVVDEALEDDLDELVSDELLSLWS